MIRNMEEVITKIKETPNHEQMTIEDLYQLSGYDKDLTSFRMLLWRKGIKCTRVPRGEAKTALSLKAQNVDFSDLTLKEIKEKIGYKQSLDALNRLLKNYEIAFKNSFSDDKKAVLAQKDAIIEKIKLLGDTSNMHPKEIMEAVGVEMQYPAPFLKRFKIAYKNKPRKN